MHNEREIVKVTLWKNKKTIFYKSQYRGRFSDRIFFSRLCLPVSVEPIYKSG